MDDTHATPHLYRTGGIATAEKGCVLLDGPDGIAIALTPDAAHETGASLIAAARIAREQARSPG